MSYCYTPNYRTLNRLVGNVLNDALTRSQQFAGEQLYIPLDVQETAEAYLITASLPGLQASDIQLEVQENTLKLSGSLPEVPAAEGAKYVLRERHFGNFQRVLKFAKQLNAEQVSARLVEGVLTVTLPKVAEIRPKSVSVQVQNA